MASLVAALFSFPLLLAAAVLSSAAGSCLTNRIDVSASRTDVNMSVSVTASCSTVSIVAATSYSITGFVATVANFRASASGGAQLTLSDSVNPKVLTLTVPTTSTSPYDQRQAILGAVGRFDAILSMSASSNGSSASAQLTVQPISVGACPPGWRRGSFKSNSVCYGVPVANDNANFADSATLCRLMRANLAMDFNSFAGFDLATVGKPHWIGVMERNAKLYFISGQPFYQTPSQVPRSPSCTPTASDSCSCVYYQDGTFYRGDCSSRYAQLCSAPLGGTAADKFYDPSSISVYISRWSASTSGSATVMLLWGNYWPAFAVVGFVVVGLSVGFRIFYRMRAVRLMERRRQMPGSVVVAATVAAMQPPPPPGSYPTQAATDLAVWHQPQTMDHQPQPPPYSSYYSNSGFQADQATLTGATATAPVASNETKVNSMEVNA